MSLVGDGNENAKFRGLSSDEVRSFTMETE